MWISCVCDELKEYYLVVQKETHDPLATVFDIVLLLIGDHVIPNDAFAAVDDLD